MDEEILKNLCEIAKRECKITWENENTKESIKGIVENAIPKLSHRLGIKEKDYKDFLEPGGVRAIFEEYCKYAWNSMTSEFEKNYKEDILTERHKYEVKYAKEKADTLQ